MRNKGKERYFEKQGKGVENPAQYGKSNDIMTPKFREVAKEDYRGVKKRKNIDDSEGAVGLFASSTACGDGTIKYSGPKLTDVEKSIQAATGQSKETIARGKFELKEKRNLRDETERDDVSGPSPNHGRIWEVVQYYKRVLEEKTEEVQEGNDIGSG